MQLTYVLTIAGVLTAGAGTARAQEPPPTSVPQTQTQVPATAPAPVAEKVTVATAPLSAAEVMSRRRAITMMEGLLAQAVRLGATETARELQAIQPGLTMFATSVARAKGVDLEGYGVFFHVEIPGVRPSVASMIETIARDRTNRENLAVQASAGAGGSTSAMPRVLTDPNAAYVDAVKSALINAMLDYTKALTLRPDEWLAVAARGDDVPLMPGEIFESRPMILRVRGSDLAEFLAGRLTRDEVRKRVQVREF